MRSDHRRKRAFSLLEILICISILALLGGTLILGGARMIARQRFMEDVKKVALTFNQLRYMAAGYNCDFKVTLRKEGNHVILDVTTDERGVKLGVFKHSELSGINELSSEKNKALIYWVRADSQITPPDKLSFSYKEMSKTLLIEKNGTKILSQDAQKSREDF